MLFRLIGQFFKQSIPKTTMCSIPSIFVNDVHVRKHPSGSSVIPDGSVILVKLINPSNAYGGNFVIVSGRTSEHNPVAPVNHVRSKKVIDDGKTTLRSLLSSAKQCFPIVVTEVGIVTEWIDQAFEKQCSSISVTSVEMTMSIRAIA